MSTSHVVRGGARRSWGRAESSWPIRPKRCRTPSKQRPGGALAEGQVDRPGGARGEGIVTTFPPLRVMTRVRCPRSRPGARCPRRSPSDTRGSDGAPGRPAPLAEFAGACGSTRGMRQGGRLAEYYQGSDLPVLTRTRVRGLRLVATDGTLHHRLRAARVRRHPGADHGNGRARGIMRRTPRRRRRDPGGA
jgi:hypothetical protein